MIRDLEIDSAKQKVQAAGLAHEVRCPDVSRRLRLLTVNARDWPLVKAISWAEAFLKLPPDAEIVAMYREVHRTRDAFVVRSREWSEVPDGTQLPELRAEFMAHEEGQEMRYELTGFK